MGIQTDHRGRGWGIGKWVVFRGCLENGRMGWQHVASVHHGSCLYCWYSGRDRHVANIYWMKYNPDIPAPQPPSVGKNDVLTREDIWCQALRVLVINPKITHALITILDISFKPVNACQIFWKSKSVYPNLFSDKAMATLLTFRGSCRHFP